MSVLDFESKRREYVDSKDTDLKWPTTRKQKRDRKAFIIPKTPSLPNASIMNSTITTAADSPYISGTAAETSSTPPNTHYEKRVYKA